MPHPVEVHPLWLLPFGTLLALIALMPLFAKEFWEHKYGWVATALALVGLGYYVFVRGDLHPWAHEMKEYVSFIALLASLYVVSGGIVIRIPRQATPMTNTSLLLIGALLANVLGTTGASMLLIRPFLRINHGHIRPYHVVFFIFIVSNCGGSLTPIGDPPLFLGYLKGVPFNWTIEHLWPAWLMCVSLLAVVFFVIDVRHSRQFARAPHKDDGGPAVAINGAHNLLFLFIIIVAVFQQGLFFYIDAMAKTGVTLQGVMHLLVSRELLMFYAALASTLTTGKWIHTHNGFHYGPIIEVAVLFLGIFSTMAPALEYLGQHAEQMPLKTPGQYYFSSGVLSSVLDNAPTYLTFLETELGRLRTERGDKVEHVLKAVQNNQTPGPASAPSGDEEIDQTLDALQKYHRAQIRAGTVTDTDVEIAMLVGIPALNLYLVAISLGAVFFGACTYIGNGPNFMVKSIAEADGVAMPSFIGYILCYTLTVLLPIYVLVWAVFFVWLG